MLSVSLPDTDFKNNAKSISATRKVDHGYDKTDPAELPDVFVSSRPGAIFIKLIVVVSRSFVAQITGSEEYSPQVHTGIWDSREREPCVRDC